MAKLLTCHPDIQVIMLEVIKHYDCSIVEGLRTAEQQMKYFKAGKSTLDGVTKMSKHQDDGSGLSRAVDVMPYKKGTNAFSGKETDNRRFYFMAGIIRMCAMKLHGEGKITHHVRFGLDWDSDDVYGDQNFHDLPHLELI